MVSGASMDASRRGAAASGALGMAVGAIQSVALLFFGVFISINIMVWVLIQGRKLGHWASEHVRPVPPPVAYSIFANSARFFRGYLWGSTLTGLFNGGVFKAEVLRTRLLEVLGSWLPGGVPPRELTGSPDLDHAVARGAAYYGWAKRRGGIRIRGGTARAYYVGIETAGLAVPGATRPLRALCVVPIGMEEGTQSDVPSEEIGLVVGEPAAFRFFSSSTRKQDRPGGLLTRWSEEELEETDSLEATLPRDESIEEDYVPVAFQSRITELGMFELWCVNAKTNRRWKLEFSVREEAE